MMIKSPGGDVAWYSMLWLIVGVFITAVEVSRGEYLMATVFAILPLGCLLMWMGVRAAKWLVVFYLTIACAGAVLLSVRQGFDLKTTLKGALCAYCVWIFASWNGSEESQSVSASRE